MDLFLLEGLQGRIRLLQVWYKDFILIYMGGVIWRMREQEHENSDLGKTVILFLGFGEESVDYVGVVF